MDIPRIFDISESAHRIHNPFTPEKLATLGAALRLEPGTRVLDLGSGSGEMLCTWARDYGIGGMGIDMSRLFTEKAKLRAEELGVADRVEFIHGDATGFVAEEKVGVAACVGATWIGGGVAGTIDLLARNLLSGGIILIGEPYWLQLPPTEEVARACRAGSISDFRLLPELLMSFANLDYDVVEMVLADQDSWDRYEAAKWLTMRRWLESNPDDDFATAVRAELTSAPQRHAAYTREYLGWGVFALMSPRWHRAARAPVMLASDRLSARASARMPLARPRGAAARPGRASTGSSCSTPTSSRTWSAIRAGRWRMRSPGRARPASA